MGYAPTFFGVDGMDGILTADNFDAALAEGVYLLTPFSADAEDELTQNFVAKYQEATARSPTSSAPTPMTRSTSSTRPSRPPASPPTWTGPRSATP